MAPWMILAALGAALAIAAVTWLVAAALVQLARALDMIDDSGDW